MRKGRKRTKAATEGKRLKRLASIALVAQVVDPSEPFYDNQAPEIQEAGLEEDVNEPPRKVNCQFGLSLIFLRSKNLVVQQRCTPPKRTNDEQEKKFGSLLRIWYKAMLVRPIPY
jgi:hypothetical protein